MPHSLTTLCEHRIMNRRATLWSDTTLYAEGGEEGGDDAHDELEDDFEGFFV